MVLLAVIMEAKENIDNTISRQNIAYYNDIAGNYEEILQKDTTNEIVRKKVASSFMDLVQGSLVLDFGGGTGMDLEWLLQQGYAVIFCEPSSGMRALAIERAHSGTVAHKIIFLADDKTNFRNWTENSPFSDKVDAILANFAVLNCIPDLDLVFEKLALAIKPGGVMQALLLETSLVKRLRSNPATLIKSLFSGKTQNYLVEYNGQRQKVYVHSIRSIKKAARPHFKIISTQSVGGFGFSLIHLNRL
jgi:SAM-dependent methyltransferase